MTRARAQLGMSMFLIAEAVFFFLLILAFAYFRALPSAFEPSERLFTVFLIASCVSLWRAVAGSRLWLWITIALGAAFLAGQVAFYGTVFFTLAGIHGLHVFGGLIALGIVPSTALRTMALYWYFFALVWLVIFVVVSARSAV